MAKKRTKKYRPRSVSIPPMLTAARLGEDALRKLEEEDETFLLRAYHKTAEKIEYYKRIRRMQAAWIMAAKMTEALALRETISDGIVALGCFATPEGMFEEDGKPLFDDLASALEVTRRIEAESSPLELRQAMAALRDSKVNPVLDRKEDTAEEV